MRKRGLWHLLLALIFVSYAKADDTRVLQTIDFEERRLGNVEELPMNWQKVEGPGLPHYVEGKLTDDCARHGKYSFRFDLSGGGLIYRYQPKLLKVQPGAHYRLSVWCKTSVLPRARARMTVYMIDEDSRVVPGSTTRSRLFASEAENQDWQELVVEIAALDPRAKQMVLQLELLQPAQYRDRSLGDRSLFTEDIQGTAWFDDLVIAQVPHVAITTNQPGNIFRKDDPIDLHIEVVDRLIDDLSAELSVRDAADKIVYQKSGSVDLASAESPAPGHKRLNVRLPDLPSGWYRASITMHSKSQFVGDQNLDFVHLGDNNPNMTIDPRFGIVATSLPSAGWSELPTLLPFLAAGRVKVSVWAEHSDIQQDSRALDDLIERLSTMGITPTACLTSLPTSIADRCGGASLAHLATARVEDWQPALAFLISRHANHIERWQVGEDGSNDFVNQPAMRTAYSRIRAAFAALMQRPDLAMPWPAWYDLNGEMPATVALSIPATVLPSQISHYVDDINTRKAGAMALHLQMLDREAYGREVQIRDLAQRMTYAMIADVPRIDLDLPFTVKDVDGTLMKQPQETLLILRTIIGTLGGSSYRGKVQIADGVEAFLFEKAGQSMLVLWTRENVTSTRNLTINLGAKATRMDLWGNVMPLVTADVKDSIKLDIGPMPTFLLDVDGPQAQMRASIGIDKPLLESSFVPHVRKLQIANPYRIAVSGDIRILAPAGWTVGPASFPINLNPGEKFSREITLELPYSSFAGDKTLMVEVSLQNDRGAKFTVPLTLKLGLSDVGMQTLALRDGKDVVVQQMITNYSDKSIDYNAFVVFPGRAREERIVSGLGPGRTTIKRYRFTAATLSGDKKIRAGIREINGNKILNDEVSVQ